MTVVRAIVLALFLLGCSRSQPEALAQVDHVIVGVSDLGQGMADIERLTGARPVIGGAHPGAGTQNALLSLGNGTYLEIYAPNPAERVDSSDVAELRALKGPTPIGWAASAPASARLRSALSRNGFELTAAEPGSRQKPDGEMLRWTTFGFTRFDHPLAPFFITWSDPAQHPSRTSPGGCTLRSLSIHDPDADQLRRAIEPLGVPVAISKAAQSRLSVRLRCPRGDVTIG